MQKLHPLQEAQLDAVYGYHAPTEDQVARYDVIREAAKAFERAVRLYCPPSADMMAAVRQIRDARMTANRAIALEGIEVISDPRREEQGRTQEGSRDV